MNPQDIEIDEEFLELAKENIFDAIQKKYGIDGDETMELISQVAKELDDIIKNAEGPEDIRNVTLMKLKDKPTLKDFLVLDLLMAKYADLVTKELNINMYNRDMSIHIKTSTEALMEFLSTIGKLIANLLTLKGQMDALGTLMEPISEVIFRTPDNTVKIKVDDKVKIGPEENDEEE